MPTNYGLRTPLYAQATTGNSLVKSAKLLLSVDGTLVYTIVKDVVTSVPVVFEIAELLRDYLDITISDSFAAPVSQKITFTSTITFYSEINAGGSAVGSPVSTLSGDGYEGYSKFIDGANSSIPYANRASNQATWLLAEKTPATAATNDDFEIFVPEDYSGYAAHMSAAGVVSYEFYRAEDTFIITNNVLLTINRINCTKYGVGTKVAFINRFGVLQDLWFFLKKVKQISKSNESYQANTLLPDATYSQSNPTVKLLNTKAKQSRTLSSGYYPEWTNAYFEELLLSENVWITREKVQQPNTPEIIPVTVRTSNMTYKTSLNDRLIEYTIDFEDAFDYINNVR
jgi:hypothetical protein